MESKFIPIEDSYVKSDLHISVVERYYTPRYSVGVPEFGDDYCILMHSNKVCVITLAPSHSLLKNEKSIDSVKFKVSEDELNKVSGKKKLGAHKVQPCSQIILVQCNKRNYILRSCITGKLLEINKQLIDNPNYLLVEPQGRGYLGIVLPNFSDFDNIRVNLLTYEQYTKSHENNHKFDTVTFDKCT